MLATLGMLLTSIAPLADAPLVVRAEVVARGGGGERAWTTVVVDRVLAGAPGAGALTYTGGPSLPLGARVVLPLERSGAGFAVPAGAGPVGVHTTREIDEVEDAVLARAERSRRAVRAATLAALVAAAGLLAAGLRRASTSRAQTGLP